MTSRLIVNADDFGLTEGTNQAIIDAHQKGIVTSTSLLANGYAFDHAVKLAHENPSLGIGVHLTLTEGPPVGRPDSRLHLDSNKHFPLSNQPFVRDLITGRLHHDAIRREFEAQIGRVIAAGFTPTHVDGHKYIHLLPGIAGIVADLARQLGVPVMRVPHRIADRPSEWARSARIPGMLILIVMGTLAYRTARRVGLHMSNRVLGFVDTGHLDYVAIRRLLLSRAPYPGTTELLCHPAYRSRQLDDLLARGYRWIASYDFDAETAAVSDPDLRRALTEKGWILQSFRA
jgi:predicted glycoside hydrolase/deacetylase ChbG (UPF0249 family)